MTAVETFRSVVAPSDCDHLGHMNVSRYFAAVSDGVFSFQTLVGLDAKDIREGRKLSFAVVKAQSEFKSELEAGEVIRLLTTLKSIGNKSVVFRHTLERVRDEVVAFEVEFHCVLLNLGTRRATEIPADLRERMSIHLEAKE